MTQHKNGIANARRAWRLVGLTLGILSAAAALPSLSLGAMDSATERRYLEGLRGRGYYDLTLDHLGILRASPLTPKDLKDELDFEEGKTLLEAATRTADIERQRDLIEKARLKLDSFIRANPNHPLNPAARAQKAGMLIERGNLTKFQADEVKDNAEREAKLVTARRDFDEARKDLDETIIKFGAELKTFPAHIEPKDPRHQRREAIQIDLMQAEFKRATVEYADGHTYPEGHAKRKTLLDEALRRYKEIADKHRTVAIGLYAKMWQGKSYEESGRLGEAMGIYNELMEHRVQQLLDLQRRVDYFRMLVMHKRGEFALAADEAVRWMNSSPGYLNTVEGLGVQLEYARNLAAQLEGPKSAQLPEVEKTKAKETIRKTLRQVVRIYSPHKAEAVKLLEKYDPKSALKAEDIAKMTYEEAMLNAEEAINTGNHEQAVALLKVAIDRAWVENDKSFKGTESERRRQQIDKANRARYMMSYCCYVTNRFYEAAVLAEFIARRYPEFGLAPKAAELGMAAHIGAYNAYPAVSRGSDLERLLDFCSYIAQQWGDLDQGNSARMTASTVKIGQGKFEEGIALLDAVTVSSGRKTDAKADAGKAHLRWADQLRKAGKAPEAERETQTGIAKLAEAYKDRLDKRVPATDATRMDHALTLSRAYLARNQHADALRVLTPLAEELQRLLPVPAPILDRYTQVVSTFVLANIQAKQRDRAVQAVVNMRKAGADAATMTNLYYRLGSMLEKEIADAKAKNDATSVSELQAAMTQLIDSLSTSEAGQTYETLQWAGEALLKNGKTKEAVVLFEKVTKDFLNNDDFKIKNIGPKYDQYKYRTWLHLAEASNLEGKHDKALEFLAPMLGQNPPLLEAMFQEARVHSAKANASKDQRDWNLAIEKWRTLAKRLGNSRPRPPEYFDANHALAEAIFQSGDSKNAKLVLRNLLRLNKRTMKPEQIAAYEELLNRSGQ